MPFVRGKFVPNIFGGLNIYMDQKHFRIQLFFDQNLYSRKDCNWMVTILQKHLGWSYTGFLLETDQKYGLISWARKRPISLDK